jgi:hypothetical protein
MAFLFCLFIGAAGITVDLGHAYVCYRELQGSTDAAALAAGYELSQPLASVASVKAVATKYGSAANGANVNSNLPNATITTDVNCSSSVASLGILCSSSSTGYNVVRVTQSVVVPTYFMKAFAIFGVQGAKSVPLTAVSTAAARGATNAQYNVAVVIDTTASMNTNDNDAACKSTRIHCALQGVQTLLKALSPCTTAGSGKDCSGGKAFDQVSLFTFPNIQANQASRDTSCPSSNPTIPSYSTPVRGATWSAPTGTSATYQITGYSSDWSSTGKQNGALNTSSTLGIAAGVSTASNCKGLQAPGGDGTYYAGAIYAAQSSLMAAQAANPKSENALIILSDGDAQSDKINVTGTVQKSGSGKPALSVDYPSGANQCQQAIDAAAFASSQGTTVYTIAYGASNSGCSKDKSGPLAGISPCSTLKKMATAPANFFSDADASQNKGQCTSTENPNLSLDQIFKAIQTSLSYSRLVPNSYYS